MSLELFNTLTRKKSPFRPLEAGQVKLYTCGPTVYDTAHIGNMRTFIFEDLLRRYLTYAGYKVLHVMNITDVDDKTIERAIREDRDLQELTGHYTESFIADLATLNILPAQHLPRATEFVAEMAAGIETLVQKGHAYATPDGSVFFDISSFDGYGQLVNLQPDQQRAGERTAEDDYGKDQAADFALWKAHKPSDGPYQWPSPWGPGRPGWHMECSIMSTHFLGPHFDIHCGGVDNIFPHHENEIAQSRCLFGTPFVETWLHSEHLIVDGEKMSKSRGNFYTLADILDRGYSAAAVRYTLLTTHYRQQLNFTFAKVAESQKALNRLRELARRLEQASDGAGGEEVPAPDAELRAALDNDLNIAGALGAIFGWAKELFGRLDGQTLGPAGARAALEALRRYDEILGCIFVNEAAGDAAAIEALLKERNAARSAGDWARADAIRDELAGQGIILEDGAEGTVWKRG